MITDSTLSICVFIILFVVTFTCVIFLLDLFYCLIFKRWTVSMYLNARPSFIDFTKSSEYIWVPKVKK